MSTKVITLKKAIKLRKVYKNRKIPVALLNGVFDILHYGHILYFREAKKFAKKNYSFNYK